MTSSFTQQINGKPNYFIEKIWAALKIQGLPFVTHIQYLEYCRLYSEKFGTHWDTSTEQILFDDIEPKIHTIRRDEHNRWRAGMDIHPVINNRTPNRFQFSPVIKCISVQPIYIRQRNDLPMTTEHWRYGYRQKVTVRDVNFYNFYQITVDNS